MAATCICWPMPDIRLNDTDKDIIRELQKGRNLPINIAEDIDKHPQYVRERLLRLKELGVVRNLGRGVYELIEDEIPESYDDE